MEIPAAGDNAASGRFRETGLASRMQHVVVLDGLRAISILLVFVAHAGLEKIVPGGLGVTVFFFLSGFLITSLMRVEVNRSGTVSLSKFYLRRVLRIIPPLWITMAFILTMALSGVLPAPLNPIGLGADLLFLSNYAVMAGISGFPTMPLWSLAVEEHFYLFFPLLVGALVPRVGTRRFVMLCVAACLAVLIVRTVYVYGFGITAELYYWTHTRIDSILFGAILALAGNPALQRDIWRPRAVHLVLALATILLTLLYRDEGFRHSIRYTLQGGALLVIFSWVMQNADSLPGRLLSARPMQIIGLYSYTIYLAHQWFFAVSRYYLPDLNGAIRAVIVGAGVVCYAFLMFRLVERPLARMRQRLNQDETNVLPPVVASVPAVP